MRWNQDVTERAGPATTAVSKGVVATVQSVLPLVLVAFLVGPAALLTIVGFLGGWWWMFDQASALRPQYAVVLAVGAVALGLLGWRRTALLVVALAVVNLALVAPLWLASPVPAASDETLRVRFHNVHGGGDERVAAVTAALADADADVIFLSEVSPRWVGMLEAADTPYSVVHPRHPRDHRRIIALSRVPVETVQAVPLVEGGRAGGIAVDLRIDGRTVRVLGIHAQSPRNAQRAAMRDAELAVAAEWIAAQSVPVVVIGDLNATAWSHAFRSLRRTTGLRDSQRGFGLQPTWRAGTGPLMVPIDHALHDPSVTIVERTTGPSLGSTHRSLQIGIAWPAS
jgi:endonuclease/exonuclease/phosphatase (EEP) superfamily protein YafD